MFRVTELDLRIRYRIILGTAIGTAAYSTFSVLLYPAFKDQTNLNKLTETGSPVAAVWGDVAITTPPGFLNATLYAYIVPLIQLIVTIGYGAHAIAGQDEHSNLGLVATQPLTRRAIAIDKLIALFTQSLVVPTAAAVCVLAGRFVGLKISPDHLSAATGGLVLLGLFFGTVAMFVGAVTGSRGLALGSAGVGAAAAYFLSSLAPLITWLKPYRYASAFYYAISGNQLSRGLPVTYALVLIAATLAFAVWIPFAFSRLDLR